MPKNQGSSSQLTKKMFVGGTVSARCGLPDISECRKFLQCPGLSSWHSGYLCSSVSHRVLSGICLSLHISSIALLFYDSH